MQNAPFVNFLNELLLRILSAVLSDSQSMGL